MTPSSPRPAPWKVLIFPGATEIALEIREALVWCKEVELFSAGASVSNHAPFVFAHHFIVPAVTQPGWQTELQRVIAREGITHIFPAHDDALLALAENAANFTAKVVTSPLETCRIARSKSATLRHLETIVPTPRLYRMASEILHYPVFLKPDRGQGAQGTALGRNRIEVERLLAEQPDRIVIEHLPGEEFTIDCFSDRERGLLFAGARSRRRIRSGIAMDSHSVDQPEFSDYARRIAQALPLHGAWFFQLKRDRDQVLKLLEVAPRIAGTSALTRARGVNLPLLSVYEAERLPVSLRPATHTVEIDRALRNRYRHNLSYGTIYVDFDDTLVVKGRIHHDLIKLLYQALDRGVRLVLITRHAGDLPVALRRHRLDSLFDEIFHLRAQEPKAHFIRDESGIFIDDSFNERRLVHEQTGIAVFSPAMIDSLLDERL
jgi:carbamoyl-phosphate synthase large subunit